MKKNIFKIIIGVIVILAIIIGIMYLIDLNKMKNGEEVVFSTWGAKYAPVMKKQQNENYKKYSKTINNVNLELNIPNEWKYKEESIDNDTYEFALKLYKNNEEQYAMIYYYKSQFGVCGTGRTSKTIALNNGNEATIGYYDENKNWSDISFFSINKNIAVMNYGLIDNDAKEVIEFIKTISIEKRKDTESLEIAEERTKLEDLEIKVNDTDTTKLVKFNDDLYGKSYALIDYAGDMSKSIGKIDYLIEEEYLPIINGETNYQEFYGANVLEIHEESMILNVDNIAVLFEKIDRENIKEK